MRRFKRMTEYILKSGRTRKKNKPWREFKVKPENKGKGGPRKLISLEFIDHDSIGDNEDEV